MKNKLHLISLTIQNFATIENQKINFETGLNAIVGETGSGKSLILDALELIFGQRAKKQMIRKGSSFASIEAIINCKDQITKDYLFKLGHPFDSDEIIIKRIIYSSGKSQTFLNFQATSLQILQTISKRFIDIVGQFENQKLLSSKYQLLLLDKYSKLNTKKEKYTALYNSYQLLQNEIINLKNKTSEQSLKIDYLQFQIQEIEELNPSKKDEQILIEKKDKLIKRQNRKEIISSILRDLSESDSSVLNTMSNIIRKLESIDDNDFNPLKNKLSESYHQLEDASYAISKNSDDANNENELQQIVDKLDLYQRLKRKFKLDTNELSGYLADLKNELQSFITLDETISQKEGELTTIYNEAFALALNIHEIRSKKASILSDTLTSHIQTLNMEGARLVLKLNQLKELTPQGISEIKFMAETNPGNGIHLVKDVASGGELSRILLAYRQVISSTDSISIFLFDEIDTGIGGHTALAIGQALSDVAQNSQVILITHLPQIAMFSNHLIQVTKTSAHDNSGKSVTHSIINEVTDKKDRVNAISAMSPL